MQFFGYRNRPAAEAAEHQHEHPTEADIKAAYLRGRKDAKRRRHPLLALMVVVVAIIGVAVIATAARHGSFSRGGQVVDAQLAVAADQAAVTSRDAAAAASEAARDAAHTVRNSNADDRAG